MGLADIGNEAVGGEGICAIPFYLLLVVGAHFDDGEPGVFPDRQDGKGDTNMIVEVAFCGIGCECRGQDGVDQFFGGGLAVAAGDGDEWDVELFPVVEGELLEGGKDVGDEDEVVGLVPGGFVGTLRGGFVDDGVGGAELEGFCRKQVAVEVWAFEGEEEVAGRQLARVGLDRRVTEIDVVELFDSHKKALPKILNCFLYKLRHASQYKSYSSLLIIFQMCAYPFINVFLTQ